MSELQDIVTLLQSCEGKPWRKFPSASEQEIIAAERELGVQFSDEYRQFLLYSDGGDLERENLGELLIFTLEELCELNPHPVWSPGLPGALFFGGDNGDLVLYFDTENRVCRGAWSIYGVGMGASSFEYSMYVADNLAQFVERVLSGEDIFNAPYLKYEGFAP